MKITVGLSRKVGQANYGSQGASCSVEIEAEADLPRRPEDFHARVQHAFALCRSAVERQLGGHATEGTSGSKDKRAQEASWPSGGPSATDKQVRAIYAMAKRQNLGLAELLTRFGVFRPDQLTVRQASELLDQINCADREAG